MFKPRLKVLGLLAVSLFLTACVGETWQTSYKDVIDPKVARGWHVVAVDVTVPHTLTVSEANTFAPNADIVWRGDPPGDRYQQVDKILTDAIKRGASALKWRRSVKLLITAMQFHALTEKIRAVLSNAGVHNIIFSAQVVDARSGKPLSPVDVIQADLVAYSGEQALEAERQGLTQKVRIEKHVADVIAGWLGIGPDVRGSFSRTGR